MGCGCLSNNYSFPHFLSVLLIWYSHITYCWGFFSSWLLSFLLKHFLPWNYPQWIFINFVGMQTPEEFSVVCTNKHKTTRFSRWTVLWGSSEALDLISLTLYLNPPNLLSFLLLFHWANKHISVNQELNSNSFCHVNFTMLSMIKTSYFLPAIFFSSLLTV